MGNKKITIAVIGVLVAVALLGVLIVYGIVAGGKKNSPQNVTATLSMWGLDDGNNYSDIFAAFKKAYPNVTIAYRGFTDGEIYESALVNALAAGQGPDIFEVQNSDARNEADKIFPLPASVYSAAQVSADFPDTVAHDFVYHNLVYALPLSIDTLALIYNQDLFNAGGVALPPTTWSGVQSVVPQLTKYASGTVAQSAIALGTAGNIPNAKDIVSALWYQKGVSVTDGAYTRGAFATQDAADALNFYLQFARPSSQAYTWDASLPNARDMFAAGRLAMLIDDDEGMHIIAEKAPFIHMGVAELPQLASSTVKATYARYWGWTVARQSKQPQLAWAFVRGMATNPAYAEGYMLKSKQPPALRTLIAKYAGSGSLGVFARQALVGEAWQDPDSTQTDGIFVTMIQNAGTAPSTLPVLQDAAAQLTNLMTPRF